MRGRCWLIVAIAAVTSARAARADARLGLDVEGACNVDTVRAATVALLGSDPFDASASRVVRVDASTTARGVSATITIVDADGSLGPRVLEAPTCEELSESLAIVVAAIVPGLSAEAPVEAPVAASADTAAEVGASTDVGAGPRVASGDGLGVVAGVSRGPARPWRLGVAIGAAGTASDQRFAGEMTAGVAIRRGARSLGVGVRARLPEHLAIGTEDARVDVSRVAFELAPCAHVGAFAACGTAAVGWIGTSSTGLLDPSPARLPTVGLGARVMAEHALTPAVAVRARVDLRAALTTTRILVDQMPVWTSDRVEAGVGFDVFARLP